MQKILINEIFILRTIACLSILLLHSLARGFLEENQTVLFYSLLLTFGTPTFVFISEFILARTYRDSLPSNFWRKRVKYIIMPYLFFGTFYAFVKGAEQSLTLGSSSFETIGQLLWKHIFLGDYHGYFILVILQFYVLHYFLDKYLKVMNPVKIMATSLSVNILYLGFFNFIAPYPNEIGTYIWEKFYWIPFFGWIFYFTLAYYCGRYYTEFIKKIKQYSIIVLTAPILLGMISLYLFKSEIITSFSSKRIDMLFFSTSVIVLLYFISMKVRQVPRLISYISQYSFGIYLFHPLFLAIMAAGFNIFQIDVDPYVKTLLYFIVSLSLSMIATYALNKVPYGYFFSGKIGLSPQYNEKIKTASYSRKAAESKF